MRGNLASKMMELGAPPVDNMNLNQHLIKKGTTQSSMINSPKMSVYSNRDATGGPIQNISN
jgi:hypothetical protein